MGKSLMHICEYCKERLEKRATESAYYFARRRFCSQDCYISFRMDKMQASDAKIEKQRKAMPKANVTMDKQITNAILTPEIVRSIRELHDEFRFTAREIAEFKGLKVPTVTAVIRRKTWAHID